jgi:hypothetical protein
MPLDTSTTTTPTSQRPCLIGRCVSCEEQLDETRTASASDPDVCAACAEDAAETHAFIAALRREPAAGLALAA